MTHNTESDLYTDLEFAGDNISLEELAKQALSADRFDSSRGHLLGISGQAGVQARAKKEAS